MLVVVVGSIVVVVETVVDGATVVTVVLVDSTVGTVVAAGDNVEIGSVTWGVAGLRSISAVSSAEPPQEARSNAVTARRDRARMATTPNALLHHRAGPMTATRAEWQERRCQERERRSASRLCCGPLQLARRAAVATDNSTRLGATGPPHLITPAPAGVPFASDLQHVSPIQESNHFWAVAASLKRLSAYWDARWALAPDG